MNEADIIIHCKICGKEFKVRSDDIPNFKESHHKCPDCGIMVGVDGERSTMPLFPIGRLR